ncbi:MAG: lysophospholipid acyltransferase family protein [Rhodobacteraceae bacterium]|nr:lysophospholipid acyltransferase family protein [Paracoccaceae bacterium]
MTGEDGNRRKGSGRPRRRLRDRLRTGLLLVLVRVLSLLPYRARVAGFGWVTARVIAPLLGERARMARNLRLAMPELGEAEVRRLLVAIADNAGRNIAETASPAEFIARVRDLPLEGPGASVLEAAHREGRPLVLAGAHLGNYHALRAALIARGVRFGAIYKPRTNPVFEPVYRAAMEALGRPVFANDRAGLIEMVRFLRAGGMVAILIDQRVRGGPVLRFFGHRATTPLTAAELALRYDAPLVTGYGIRKPDGFGFTLWIGAPIPPSDPLTMTQALNDDIEAVVRAHPDQWIWGYRRWERD